MARSVASVPDTGAPELDGIDARLIDVLQTNGRATYAELAAEVGLKPPATYERVRNLEARGVIRNYGARLDGRKVGLGLVSFVSCYTTPESRYEDFVARCAAFPEVLEIHSVAGDESYILKVRTRSTAHLDELLSRLKITPGIGRTRTTVVLSTPFERDGIALQRDAIGLQ